jgi:hypothetical protein
MDEISNYILGNNNHVMKIKYDWVKMWVIIIVGPN